MAEWQDISTAPKDGTSVLLLDQEGRIGIGYMELRGFDGYEHVSSSAAWTERMDGYTRVFLGGWKPTEAMAWQPLPTPPSQKAQTP